MGFLTFYLAFESLCSVYSIAFEGFPLPIFEYLYVQQSHQLFTLSYYYGEHDIDLCVLETRETQHINLYCTTCFDM